MIEAGIRSRPIIILGVDRSGTSIVARLAHEWGAYGGDLTQLMRSDPANPKGYWENRSLVLFIHEIFKAVGPEFWRTGFDEALRSKADDPTLRDPAAQLVAGMAGAGPAWFWKEPLLSLQLPFWKELWGDATYIITVRNPYDSAVSWEKMMVPREVAGRISILALNLLRWQHFMLTILRHLDGSKRKLFVPYEDLVRDPRSQCLRICDFLDAETGLENRSEERLERMAQAVDPDLWRNRSETDFSQVEIATREQKGLYELMQRKVEDPDAPFEAGAYPMYEGWREYLQNFSEFEAFYGSVNQLLRSRFVRLALAVSQSFASLRRFRKS
ncbi:MAG TPA: sulfotransferase [Thermoanaerobaculia bacterium]